MTAYQQLKNKLSIGIAEAIKATTPTLYTGIIEFEHPANLSHGDYATNISMVLAKESGKNPKELAEKIVLHMEQHKLKEIEKIEVAGSGFINFYLSRDFFAGIIREILDQGKDWGKNSLLSGNKIVIEYFQPNFFKALHVGHLVNVIVGESLTRLLGFSGAETYRIAYYSDVGPHIAKAVWGLEDLGIKPKASIDLSKAYEHGVAKYEDKKEEIDEINQKLYQGGSDSIHKLYKEGTDISLKQAEGLLKRLQISFDATFLESEVGTVGKKLVEENTGTVFEKSDGAIIFKGEKYGLHTRVFVTSKGLPLYESKDLGLAKLKLDMFPADTLVYVVDVEQTEYFKVILKAIELVLNIPGKTKHIAHGRLRLPTGRMSSREGNVIIADEFLDEIQNLVLERIDNKSIADQIGIAAMQYLVLKQSLGGSIVFDKERALSFEGDSGPYLQYSSTRALSVIKKASDEKLESAVVKPTATVTEIERFLYRFPEVIERATKEYEPHYVTNYLTKLAGAFNSWYGQEKILDGTEAAGHKLALTKAFQITMENGLWLLGIKTPPRM